MTSYRSHMQQSPPLQTHSSDHPISWRQNKWFKFKASPSPLVDTNFSPLEPWLIFIVCLMNYHKLQILYRSPLELEMCLINIFPWIIILIAAMVLGTISVCFIDFYQFLPEKIFASFVFKNGNIFHQRFFCKNVLKMWFPTSFCVRKQWWRKRSKTKGPLSTVDVAHLFCNE